MDWFHLDGYDTSMVILIFIYVILFFVPIGICLYAIKKHKERTHD